MKKLQSSTKAIWKTCREQLATLWMVAQLSFDQMRDHKKSFSAHLNKMFSTVVRQVVERVSLFWLTLYVIVIIPACAAFFYAALWTN